MKNSSKAAFPEIQDIVFQEDGEIAHTGPLAVAQNWEAYSSEDHEVWAFLYEKQLAKDVSSKHALIQTSASRTPNVDAFDLCGF